MKKRFLPFSLLLVIMIFGQTVLADQVGHYVPRAKENTTSAEAYLQGLRVNQHTGMIDPAWLIAASKQVERSSKDYSDIVYWKSMGPDNMGGRTTAVLYNNQNTNEAYIGSMGGGVFYTWNLGVSWHQVGENLLVSCMAQAEDGTIYVGTGDCGSAYTYNGLGDLSYENSFIGTGLYKIQNKEMNLVPGTNPADNNDPAGEWCFINDVAVDGGTVVVATGAGVKYLKDGDWQYAKVDGADLTGVANEVKVGSDHIAVASVDGKIYIGTLDNMVCKSAEGANDEETEEVGITAIGTASGLLDIAIAPSDPKTIYAANIKSSGNHVKIYASDDQGETWRIILPEVSTAINQNQVYDGVGLYYHGLVVDPTDADCLYVTSYDLWLLRRASATSNGYYQALRLTSAGSIHNGINSMAFSPRNSREAYIGTDGGIYKATKDDDPYFSFLNCNRGYFSARCLGVAPSGKLTRVVAGLLDHGPILINGLEGTNNMETGDLLLPVLTGAHYGSFDDSYSAANCFVSVINPNAFLLSTVDGAMYRTFNAGNDYDESNFMTSVTFTGYRLPMAYWECFDDEYSLEEVQFKCKKDQKAGDVVICYSSSCDYPFEYTLTQDMHFDSVHPAHSDSIYVHDPISTKLFVAGKANSSDNFYTVYYTQDAMRATRTAEWYSVVIKDDSLSYPTCMTVSPDGDNLFIGTVGNEIVRVFNLRQAVNENVVNGDTIADVKKIALPTDGQAVTSISIYPEDANKMVVTLGNYGNQNYVLYSDNALSDNPTFTVKQGNLPAMPVYSSVYTSTYDGASNGHVLIGTDHGVFRTTNIAASSPEWTFESDNMGDVPVMDLKQQIMYREDVTVTTVIDSITMETVYPGTNNQGVIYAATYGRGLFRCETYRQHSANSVPETPVVAESKVSMYPNPVRDAAKVCFELNDNTAVSYQVYDMNGRMVKAESLGNFGEGKYEVSVNMNGLAKGAYVLRLNAGSRTSSVKFMMF
jgi:hypothetical protein